MPRTDVAIIGAGIAGCAAALLFAQRGLSVLIVDRKPSDERYKRLCTHFIQPMALPVIRKLGFEQSFRELGRATRAAFWTEAGWTDPPGDYALDPAGEGAPVDAFNLERRRLDPFLLSRLRAAAGIDLRLDCRATGLARDADGCWTVTLDQASSEQEVRAGLLVAADGRQSRVAELLSAPLEFTAPNDRGCAFAYFAHCPVPAAGRSLFMHHDGGMIFYYPLPQGRALICAFLPHGHPLLALPAKEKAGALLDLFGPLPHGLDLGEAAPEPGIYGYLSYPNLGRSPVWSGCAFAGDAALSIDPMSGVGCGFAFVSADLLVESTAAALAEGQGLEAALEAYARRFAETLGPHVRGICADSLAGKSSQTIAATYARINADEHLQRLFMALTGRLVTPARFQREFLLAAIAAAPANVRTPVAAGL
ncbi:MAG TPA: NAD(P)/FAD-dependent oxidoreductase [Allosphingosinicella sp.]